MGKTESRTSQQELVAFHAALVRARKERGLLSSIIPVKEWESHLVRCLGTMTRQSCQDKTWAMDRMGLIERLEREGVRVLETASVAA